MMAFIGRLIAGKFIQDEIEKVRIELRSLVRILVEDAVKKAIDEFKYNPNKPIL